MATADTFPLHPEDVLHFSAAFMRNIRLFLLELPSIITAGNGKRKEKVGQHVTRLLEDLGPTFIKFGQLASTRADFFPEYLTRAMERLQDNIKPFPSEQAVDIVKKELGAKFTRHFATLRDKPLASGSLAQVHYGTLKNGEPVALKILRPNIEKRVQRELRLISHISRALESTVLVHSKIKPTRIIAEVGDELQRHCDFTFEMKNAQQFAKSFNGDARVIFPKPYPALSTPKVLTMEFIDGIKISQYRKVNGNPQILARIGMDAIFKMVFVDGFVHGDMHPGNIFVLRDNRIAFLDLGLVAKVTPSMKKNLIQLVLGIVNKDKCLIAKYLFIMGEGKKHSVDYAPFEEKVYETLSGHFDKPLGELRMEKLLREFFGLLYEFRLTLPPSYALLFCTLIAIEGTAKKLFPQANLFTYAQDFFQILGMNTLAPA